MLAMLSVGILTFTFAVRSASADTTVQFSPEIIHQRPGLTFTVNITITNVTDLAGWAIDLSWDPNIIRVTTGDPNGLQPPINGTFYNIYQGPFLKNVRPTSFIVNRVNNAQGKIEFLSARHVNMGEGGSGALATINFTCISVGTTTTQIIESILMDGEEKAIPHEDYEVIDGRVLVSLILIRMDPVSKSVEEGELFNITVHIDNMLEDLGMTGIQFKITWNLSYLNAVSMTEGLFHNVTPPGDESNIWQLLHNVRAGYVEYIYTWLNATRAFEMGYAPISGNHTVATITLNATAIGYTPLEFSLLRIAGLDPEDMELLRLVDYPKKPLPESYSLIESAAIVGDDTTPPNITYVSQYPPEEHVLQEYEVRVNATVTDDLSGVKQVTLNYTNGNGTWVTVDMTILEGSIWRATIPNFPYCTTVTYSIIAEDNFGNIITIEDVGYEYHVVPEFPSTIILFLGMVFTTLAVIIGKKQPKPSQRLIELEQGTEKNKFQHNIWNR